MKLKLSGNLKKHRGFERSRVSLYITREKKDRIRTLANETVFFSEPLPVKSNPRIDGNNR